MNHKDILRSLSHVIEQVHSQHLAFRPLARCDAFVLFDATQDPRMNEHLRWPTPKSVQDVLIQIDKFHRAHQLGQIIATSICLKDTGEWVGYLNFAPFRDGIEVSLGINPKTWGTRAGGGTIAHLIPQILYKAAPLTPLYMRVVPENLRMYKLCTKMGCEKIDEFTDQYDSGAPLMAHVLKLNPNRWEEIEHLPLEEF